MLQTTQLCKSKVKVFLLTPEADEGVLAMLQRIYRMPFVSQWEESIRFEYLSTVGILSTDGFVHLQPQLLHWGAEPLQTRHCKALTFKMGPYLQCKTNPRTTEWTFMNVTVQNGFLILLFWISHFWERYTCTFWGDFLKKINFPPVMKAPGFNWYIFTPKWLLCSWRKRH